MTRKEEIQQAGQQYLVMPNAYGADKDIERVVAECFVDGAEWADTTLINKVCKFIQENAVIYLDKCDDPTYMEGYFIDTERFVKDIRKHFEK